MSSLPSLVMNVADVTPAAAFDVALRLGATGALLQSGEVLVAFRRVGATGLLEPESAVGPNFWRGSLVTWIGLTLRGALALAALLLGGRPGWGCALAAALTVSQLLYNWRFGALASNADTMAAIGFAAICAGTLPGVSGTMALVALTFFAGHILFTYQLAGWDKFLSPAWRNGERLAQVFNDSSYRSFPLGIFLTRSPVVAAVVSMTIIALQILFPVCLVLPDPLGSILLLAGLLFHAAVALTMGLRDFFWSFAAGYAPLFCLHGLLQRGVIGA